MKLTLHEHKLGAVQSQIYRRKKLELNEADDRLQSVVRSYSSSGNASIVKLKNSSRQVPNFAENFHEFVDLNRVVHRRTNEHLLTDELQKHLQ